MRLRLSADIPVPRTDPPTIRVWVTSDAEEVSIPPVAFQYTYDSDGLRCTAIEALDGGEITPALISALLPELTYYLKMTRSVLGFQAEPTSGHGKLVEARVHALRDSVVLHALDALTDGHGKLVEARVRARRRVDDDFLRAIAGEYRELVAGRSRSPVKEISLAHDVCRSTAALWIKRARALGALGPALPGKAGEKAGER